MSTRASVHFCDKSGTTQAVVFRHTDGYPEGLGEDIRKFFKAIKEQCGQDTRFNDPTMLAARWVVWDAAQMADSSDKPLKFLSVRIMLQDSGDIEYRYKILCNRGWDDNSDPEVITEEA